MEEYSNTALVDGYVQAPRYTSTYTGSMYRPLPPHFCVRVVDRLHYNFLTLTLILTHLTLTLTLTLTLRGTKCKRNQFSY